VAKLDFDNTPLMLGKISQLVLIEPSRGGGVDGDAWEDQSVGFD
jgi:hypothetical protein